MTGFSHIGRTRVFLRRFYPFYIYPKIFIRKGEGLETITNGFRILGDVVVALKFMCEKPLLTAL